MEKKFTINVLSKEFLIKRDSLLHIINFIGIKGSSHKNSVVYTEDDKIRISCFLDEEIPKKYFYSKIYKISDITKELNKNKSIVSRAINALKESNYITVYNAYWQPNNLLFLDEKGYNSVLEYFKSCKTIDDIKNEQIKDRFFFRDLCREYSCSKDKMNNIFTYLGIGREDSKYGGKNSKSITLEEKKILDDFISSNTDTKNLFLRATKESKYGDSNYINKEKLKSSILDKYGVDNISKLDEIKEKKKETFKSNHNGMSYSEYLKEHSEEFTRKRMNTLIDKYGEEPYKKIYETVQRKPYNKEKRKEKYKQTCLEKYGVDNVSKVFNNKISESLKKRHDSIYEEGYETYNVILETSCTSYSALEVVLKNNNIPKIYKYNRTLIDVKYLDLIYSELSKVKDSSVSLKENQVYDFVKSIYDGRIEQSNRTILNRKELDIYIPDKNVAIEFDGLYWHSILPTEKSENTILYKTEECRKKGIRLLHIYEDEWENKKDICKSLISSSLGVYNRRIYARKCHVKEIDSKTYRNFLDTNHIQGSINSSIKLGLFYNDELVQVIGIGKNRFKSNEYELHRMATVLNTQVLGGFSKLLKEVGRRYPDIKEIFSYVDLRLFNGEGYKKTGFEYICKTIPSYFYVKGIYRYNRINFQKYKLKNMLENYDESLTEKQNMENNGYRLIYDCGSVKVKYSL